MKWPKRMKGESSVGMGVGIATAAAGLSFVERLNAWLIPFLGVPFTVLTMAAAGAGVSFIHGDKEPDVKRMLRLIIGNTFLAVLCVAIIPKMLHLEWVEPGIAPPLAAMIAWISRWAIPNVIKLMPDIWKRVFKLREYKNVGEDDYYTDETNALKSRYYDEDTKE